MPHVELVTRPAGWLQRYAWRFSRRRFGKVVDPLRAVANHRGVLAASGALETIADRRWRLIDPALRQLAIHLVSASIGCSWCIDYGYYEGQRQGIPVAKLREVPRWRESAVFDERERTVLEYAESVTATPAVVAPDLADRLHRFFTDAEIVELAGWIALENLRSRTNAALGVTAEGFGDHCELPEARPVPGAA